MATDLCLVVQTTQRHTHVLTFHGGGDGFAKGSLTHTRRTVETDNRTLLVASQGEYGHVLQDALLHLLHAVVVLVEDLLRTLQVEVVLGVFVPGQTDERLQIGELHVELRRLRVQVVQLLAFLVEHLTGLTVPFLPGSLVQ